MLWSAVRPCRRRCTQNCERGATRHGAGLGWLVCLIARSRGSKGGAMGGTHRTGHAIGGESVADVPIRTPQRAEQPHHHVHVAQRHKVPAAPAVASPPPTAVHKEHERRGPHRTPPLHGTGQVQIERALAALAATPFGQRVCDVTDVMHRAHGRHWVHAPQQREWPPAERAERRAEPRVIRLLVLVRLVNRARADSRHDRRPCRLGALGRRR